MDLIVYLYGLVNDIAMGILCGMATACPGQQGHVSHHLLSAPDVPFTTCVSRRVVWFAKGGQCSLDSEETEKTLSGVDTVGNAVFVPLEQSSAVTPSPGWNCAVVGPSWRSITVSYITSN